MENKDKNLAIIPARGGSKRIPKKNIKDFLGKPIIAYSIETALSSNLFDEVMVSTDDKEIANIAKSYGAKIPFMRSNKNSSDTATTVDVLIEVVNEYEKNKKSFNNICCIYPTAPFINIEDLKQGLDYLSEADSSLPMVEFEYPILRSLKKSKDNSISWTWSEYKNERSQDLEKFYHDAGQWYWIKKNKLLKQKTLLTSSAKGILKNRISVQDIDNIEDWKIAELKYKSLKNRK